MLVHALMPASRANGPGLRAVVFTQGCLIHCPGCHNPNTHPFKGDEMTARDICTCLCLGNDPDPEGLTISGGEPMHQAAEVLTLIREYDDWWPHSSIGMFTGYRERELERGDYVTVPHGNPLHCGPACRSVRRNLWAGIKGHLDWCIFGRYDKTLPSTLPMRASANQTLQVYNPKLSLADFGEQQLVEYQIGHDGLTQVTGFPR